MTEWIGLDFETYSDVSLPKHGLDRYVSGRYFQPLIASTAIVLSNGSIYHDQHDFAYRQMPYSDLFDSLEGKMIVAHNAPFERAVLGAMGCRLPAKRFIDSAAWARAVGVGGKLEAAAPQLLGVDKLEDGRRLIMLFSVPGKYQEANDSLAFDPAIVEAHLEDWRLFQQYCDLDSELGLRIALRADGYIPQKEREYNAVTMEMSDTGWHVDLEIVEEMQRRYLENQELALEEFRAKHDAADLNLGSLKQLKEWCLDRGIKATSFDEKNVAKLHERISKRLARDDDGYGSKTLSMEKYNGYCEVLHLLETKQILGGSSLKKLQTILDLTGEDGRLRDQYLHIGASQTWRTSGKGVQLQNLKRLGGEGDDMLELYDDEVEWDNDKLGRNLRQCFTATHPDGALIVGDFASVESRGLAWQAGDRQKLEAFRQGKDLYKVQAALIYSTPYDQVTKAQRQTGKVGELSCGYQAGGGAVQAFAEKMGVEMSEGEATKLVSDWRATNPMIVSYWNDLDNALKGALELRHTQTVRIGPRADWLVRIYATETPESLDAQHPGAQSIGVEVLSNRGTIFLRRVFHGVYVRGNSLCYYKPSELKSGDLWKSHFTDPKTKQVRFYSIYGGKLSGILTQSFCRELFFQTLSSVHAWCAPMENVRLIGQFHDEIVLEWSPAAEYGPGFPSLAGTKKALESLMSDTHGVEGFPLVAEIKHDYRYTK